MSGHRRHLHHHRVGGKGSSPGKKCLLLLFPLFFVLLYVGVTISGVGTKGLGTKELPRAHEHRPQGTSVARRFAVLDCSKPVSCYSSQCYATASDTQCKPSPFFRLPSQEFAGGGEEMVCAGHGAPDRVPMLQLERHSSPDTPIESDHGIRAFKHFTARPFDKWYDWHATCEHQEGDAVKHRVMAAGHDDDKYKVFRLKNLCVRPVGGLAGYNPRIRPFDGTDDVQSWTQDGSPMRFVREYLSQVHSLDKPPRCIVRRKLLIMPSMLRTDNPGHVFMREAALWDIRKRAFPHTHPNDITTVYLFLEGVNSDLPMERHVDLSSWKNNAFTDYTTVLSPTHFAVYGGTNMTRALREIFGQDIVEHEPRLRQPLCFEEAVVYFTLLAEEAAAIRHKAPSRPVVPLFFHRSGEVLEQFNSRLRDCSNVVSRREPNVRNPKVLLSVRSLTRRLSLAPELISHVGEYVKTKLNGTLQVHEMKDSDTVDLVRLYNSVDILLSLYGAGLFYAVFMPPGAIAIEINWAPKRATVTSGVNHPANGWTDYGGNLNSVGVHHVVISFPAFPAPKGMVWLDCVPFQPEIQFSEFNLAPSVVQEGLVLARCMFEQRLTVPSNGSTCAGNFDRFLALQAEHHRDTEGMLFRQYVRLRLTPEEQKHALLVNTRSTSKLPWLFRNAKDVGVALWPLRQKNRGMWNKVADPPPVQNTLLLMAPCGLTTTVARELSLFFHYVSMNVNITVWTPHNPQCASVGLTWPKRRGDVPRDVQAAFGTLPSCLTFECIDRNFTDIAVEQDQVQLCSDEPTASSTAICGHKHYDAAVLVEGIAPEVNVLRSKATTVISVPGVKEE